MSTAVVNKVFVRRKTKPGGIKIAVCVLIPKDFVVNGISFIGSLYSGWECLHFISAPIVPAFTYSTNLWSSQKLRQGLTPQTHHLALRIILYYRNVS